LLRLLCEAAANLARFVILDLHSFGFKAPHLILVGIRIHVFGVFRVSSLISQRLLARCEVRWLLLDPSRWGPVELELVSGARFVDCLQARHVRCDVHLDGRLRNHSYTLQKLRLCWAPDKILVPLFGKGL
jgi:hypothetical protein